jgi:hypothetical protein
MSKNLNDVVQLDLNSYNQRQSWLRLNSLRVDKSRLDPGK